MTTTRPRLTPGTLLAACRSDDASLRAEAYALLRTREAAIGTAQRLMRDDEDLRREFSRPEALASYLRAMAGLTSPRARGSLNPRR